MAQAAESAFYDPLYLDAESKFQKGDWEAGFSLLKEVMNKYPLDSDLRAINQEMRLRARIDEDERADKSYLRQRRLAGLTIRGSLLVLALAVVYFAVSTYSDWIRKQVRQITAEGDRVQQELTAAYNLRVCQDYAKAGRLADARNACASVASFNSNYTGLSETIADLERRERIKELYDEATRKVALQDQQGALMLFQDIQAQDPTYLDVSLQIDKLQNQILFQGMLDEAGTAYDAQEWKKAADQYAKLHTLNPQFQTNLVESRLFNSYIKAGEVIASDPNANMDSLKEAEKYFSKARTLRPQDAEPRAVLEASRKKVVDRLVEGYMALAQQTLAEKGDSLEALKAAEIYFRQATEVCPECLNVQNEQKKAQLFIQAQADFVQDKVNEVISGLEIVYGQDPDYASGTARQTLYEAYMARGKTVEGGGDYEAALSDYQRAAALAGDQPEKVIPIYQALQKVGKVQGVLGNYEAAVSVYQEALRIGDMIYDRSIQSTPSLASKVDLASSYAEQGLFKSAYGQYRQVVDRVTPDYTIVEHEVQAGEYLIQLINQYGTTLEAYYKVNKQATLEIEVGRMILIPAQPQ